MHEYSIVQALLAQVEAEARKHGATSVDRIELRIGELSGVEVDLLRTAFETFRERSLCARAALEIEIVAAQWSCSECRLELAPGARLQCPTCGRPARLAGGDEILLQRIEMEAA